MFLCPGADGKCGENGNCNQNTGECECDDGFTGMTCEEEDGGEGGEGGEGAKKDVGYRVLPNLTKLFIKIPYTN